MVILILYCPAKKNTKKSKTQNLEKEEDTL